MMTENVDEVRVLRGVYVSKGCVYVKVCPPITTLYIGNVELSYSVLPPTSSNHDHCLYICIIQIKIRTINQACPRPVDILYMQPEVGLHVVTSKYFIGLKGHQIVS